MVSFIKKNLLGSLREFRNRFINPIQNGQCADSTPKDVRIMKKRAHVLHAMLSRSVQVRKQMSQFFIYFIVLICALDVPQICAVNCLGRGEITPS